jgi:hypothetical protein
MEKYFWCLPYNGNEYLLMKGVELEVSNGYSTLYFKSINDQESVLRGKSEFEDIIPIQKPSSKAVANQLAKRAEKYEAEASKLRKQIRKLRKSWI